MPLRPPSLALLASLSGFPICGQCAIKLAKSAIVGQRRFSQTPRRLQVSIAGSHGVDRSYFWANGLWNSAGSGGPDGKKEDARGLRSVAVYTAGQDGMESGLETVPATANTIAGEPPHRRRKRLKQAAVISDMPPDAPSALTSAASAAPPRSLRRMSSIYLALSKPRLAFLVTLTTTAGYSIYPVPAMLSTTATAAPSLSTPTLLFLTTGTFLTIASANTLNMLFEPSHDAKMSRTRNRPLVRKLISKRSALFFAIATGILGTGALWYGVNRTTSMLGAGNLALYAFVYTPMKRLHVINTWVGALVGAVPPLMGWTAAASQYQTSTATSGSGLWDEMEQLLFSEQAVGGWLLAGLLFAWQFPHFNALSHGIRHEYAAAGYRMLCSSNVAMNTRVALRYSLAMFPICFALSYYDVTNETFVITSSAINGWMLWEAVRFWRWKGEKGSARALFWASVWHLPIVLVLAMAQKKGLWERLWLGVHGEKDPDVEWDDEGDV